MGTCIKEYFRSLDEVEEIIILSRSRSRNDGKVKTVFWDGKTVGNWYIHLDGADVLINLAGKSVNCRYTKKNKEEIIASRTNSIRALSEAVEKCGKPPKLWIQAASVTIYRHSEDRPMTEIDRETGDGFSVEVCKQWESVFEEMTKPFSQMRKVVIRTSLVLGKNAGVYPRLKTMALFGMGGRQGKGQQWVSWIHEEDVARLTEWIIKHPEITGPVNCTSPEPVKNTVFMKTMRKELGVPFGLPSPAWFLELGALLIGTETELILKSRWVLPEKLLSSGYQFKFPSVESAFKQIVKS